MMKNPWDIAPKSSLEKLLGGDFALMRLIWMISLFD
jgi:hypothetical protein